MREIKIHKMNKKKLRICVGEKKKEMEFKIYITTQA